MDWTLEDNMVNGLFFWATLTGCRWGGYTPFVQAWADTSDTSAEAVKPDPGSSWEYHSRGISAGNENVKSCGGARPLRLPLVIRSLHVCCCCQMNWRDVVWRVQMGVLIWGAVESHLMDRWALSGDVQALWHGVLETVWLHCNEAQQVECLRGVHILNC